MSLQTSKKSAHRFANPCAIASAQEVGENVSYQNSLTTMNTESIIDWDEMFEYLPGMTVELKSEPGVLHKIDYYETMMVPPVWLINDPQPRYTHELRIVSRQGSLVCSLEH
ncbi:hypothetical protein [Gloeocapsa sp. PCC 73106]|uniref:hypothetical protein n=1 Tax=Gloeocapsa sp. PCC 73106 TaxID=102232 RepID=UPI0002ABA0C6|nr:hypothetical protein [Gloeocapsa sp. PCC 73106]ELR99846.1 hypothetical protein GLO73106DRAFT_00036980 [Gloeocapsa sp. PCC 73106]